MTPEQEIMMRIRFGAGAMRLHRNSLVGHCAKACPERWPCREYRRGRKDKRRAMAEASRI